MGQQKYFEPVKRTDQRTGLSVKGNKQLRWLHCLLTGMLLLAHGLYLSKAEGQLPWHSEGRIDQLLDQDWRSAADSTDKVAFSQFSRPDFKDTGWQTVTVPHNWDQYGGYIRDKHGNFHGVAWYRKSFTVTKQAGTRYFLFFEGVSSYATVFLNGHPVGRHAGGRTAFSLEVSKWLNKKGTDNLLAVKVRHPAGIRDLPWVCGGCSDEVGFSEGSQPFGIFRPVHLIQTGPVRITPFGVHIFNDTTVNENHAVLQVETNLKSYQPGFRELKINLQLLDRNGREVAHNSSVYTIQQGDSVTLMHQIRLEKDVHLWSLEDPYLYHLKTTLSDNKTGDLLDELETPYGIRWIRWPQRSGSGSRQFLLNGKPVFINGIAGYEHALGKSHAFTREEIATRVAMIRSMGFNAFRDAHQPHNLRYQYYWDKEGVLWWPQFSAHIWFDTPAFKKNFLNLLRDWVLERRNSPSNIMWGLQNESRLPAVFAKTCVRLIRQLDPTASGQRLITTCNGGEGTDWNVPQNWSGTYGGDPDTYDKDLKKEILVGEYGGWRTVGLHTEGGFDAKGPNSIESWCDLLEKKIRLSWQVRDSVAGHFFWLLNSHDNPGRVQAAEGYRDLDKIGPVNNKGILTSWEEPTEAFYVYQSNFTKADTAPMLHIACHHWADRWQGTEQRKEVIVYSNCDSVILYNGYETNRIGVRTRAGVGTHFSWKGVKLTNNVLYAEGYYGGKKVVTDQVIQRQLPEGKFSAGASASLLNNDPKGSLLSPEPGYTYLYRYNCGGPAYKDHAGNYWAADRARTKGTYGSASWTTDYQGLPAFFASQRFVTEPVEGTSDDALFQSFRYGRSKLNFDFPVPNGSYRVELYFAEPWWGGDGQLDCTGWRDFDVAVNDSVRLYHLDIFKEAGKGLKAIKKVFDVQVRNHHILIDFPNTYSGQAVIAAIAISYKNNAKALSNLQDRLRPISVLSPERNIPARHHSFKVLDWLNIGDSLWLEPLQNKGSVSAVQKLHIITLPPFLIGAEWLGYTPDNKKKGHPDSRQRLAGRWKANGTLELYVGVRPSDTEVVRYMNAHNFTPAKAKITGRGGADGHNPDSLVVYRKIVAKGGMVKPQHWWPRTLIAFKPQSNMQPAYDQKKEIAVDLVKATYSNTATPGKRAGKSCIFFNGHQRTNKALIKEHISWPLSTGVADFHSFHIKYALPSRDSVKAVIKLVAADGKVLATENVWLTVTREGKWNNSYLTTPTMINAGDYHLILTWNQATSPLYIYSLKFR